MAHPDASSMARDDLDAWRGTAARNAFDTDHFFQRLLQRHLGDRYPEVEPRLRRLAEKTGPAFDRLVMESNRDENLPAIRRHDAHGRATEEVVFHPAYHEVGRVFWESGVLSALGDCGNQTASGAMIYLLDQHGEAGHACPVACTAGAARLLQREGNVAQRERYLPLLLSDDYDSGLRASQFVTEVQGGSDVGANACMARPDPERPGWYRITGEKWFCSVADAGLFVVSARLEGGTPGTRGLGLFLVPRSHDGSPNGFSLRRLKTKLGTRSMATGEVEFRDALGEPIGPLDQGFKNLVGIVLDASREHNALAACGIMRRALVEAHAYAGHRLAFTRRILDFPAVQETLAVMKLRTICGLATTFRILAMSDRLDIEGPDDRLTAARRIAVMINKYWTSIAGTRTARDGIEILGGNGTIEEFSALPRLYRDAIVVESWEGTHNTLCAQVLRDFATRSFHVPWLENLATEIDALLHTALEDHATIARLLQAELENRIDGLLGADEVTAAAQVRHVVDEMCRLTDWVALCTQAQWELDREEGQELMVALDLYRLRDLDRCDPLEHPELIAMYRRFALDA
jgi:alkylation response protein AidB-like acyl-CoA dehydrogenase